MENSDTKAQALAKRKALQAEAVQTLLNDKRLIVNWGTGVGKSRVAVECIRQLPVNNARVLLCVNETAHKENWRREFAKVLGEVGEELFDSIVVECYASLHKYRGTHWDFIVFDEGHHMRSDLKVEILTSLSADYVLILSATLSEKGDADVLMNALDYTFGAFKEMTFTVQEAIDENILARPTVYVHRFPLEAVTGQQKIRFDWGRADKRVPMECPLEDFEKYAGHTRDYPSMSLTLNCNAAEGYKFLCDKVSFYQDQYDRARKDANLGENDPDNKYTEIHHNRIVSMGMRRKMLLGQCKTTFVRWLLNHPSVKGKKFICFCSDVDQAEALGGENVISARRSDSQEVINAFNRGDIRSLFAVGMIQEGANLEGIEAGIIVQLGGKERVFVQKFGRTLRSDNPVQHLVVVTGTRDEDFLATALAGIDPSFIKEIDWGEKMGFKKPDSTGLLKGRPSGLQRSAPFERATAGA